MDQVNLLPDEMFDQFRQKLENQDDFWKQPDWWDALELKLTYDFRSTDPIQMSHLITIASLYTLKIMRNGEYHQNRKYLEDLDRKTLGIGELMNGFEGRKIIEFIQNLIPFLKSTPQWNQRLEYPSQVDENWFIKNRIMRIDGSSGDMGLNEIAQRRQGGDLLYIKRINKEIVTVVAYLEGFVTKGYQGLFGDLDYFDETFENVLRRVEYERKTGILADKHIEQATQNVKIPNLLRDTQFPSSKNYYLSYLVNKIKAVLGIKSSSLNDILIEARREVGIPEGKGWDDHSNPDTEAIFTEIFIEIFGEEKLPLEYTDEYIKLLHMNRSCWGKILEIKAGFKNNLETITNYVNPTKNHYEEAISVFEEELSGLAINYNALNDIKIKIGSIRNKGDLSEQELRRLKIYSYQSMKIREILMWINLLNALLKTNYSPKAFFSEKRDEILRVIVNSSPHPYILKKILAHIFFLEKIIKPSPENPPVAPFIHLDMETSDMTDNIDLDLDDLDIQEVEDSYLDHLNELPGILENSDDKGPGGLPGYEKGLQNRLLENKMKRFAELNRGVSIDDVDFQGLQDDMLQGKTNVGELEGEERDWKQDMYPERYMYLDQIGDGDKDKCMVPEESLPLSEPPSIPRPRRSPAEVGWLKEYEIYDNDTNEDSLTPPRSSESWVYGEGPELSSEVNFIDDRLVKRYADQQRRALMMNPKFGTPIGQAAELGKQYTPGRPGEGINYHDYKQRYKVPDMLDEQVRQGKRFLEKKRRWERGGVTEPLSVFDDSELVRMGADLPGNDDSEYRQYLNDLVGSRGPEIAAEKLGMVPLTSWSYDYQSPQSNAREYLGRQRVVTDTRSSNQIGDEEMDSDSSLGDEELEIEAMRVEFNARRAAFNAQRAALNAATQQGGNKNKRSKRSRRSRNKNKRKKKNKRSNRNKKGGKNQDWEKNKGYFGPIMDKKGKLNRDEICHNCTPGAYGSHARRFCKLHDKAWDRKSNKCLTRKKKKLSKRKK